MSKNKITLYYGMSINELNQFFAGLDDTTKVRARDLGGGKIQLYVRKDTFKHFFTDKLRLGFLVEHDYSKAIDRIKEIVNDRISTKSIKYADEQKSAYEELKKHTHDFSASTLKQHLTRLAEQEKKQIRAKANLNSGFPSRAYFSDSVRQILRETESIKKQNNLFDHLPHLKKAKKFQTRLRISLIIVTAYFLMNISIFPLLITKLPEISLIPGFLRSKKKKRSKNYPTHPREQCRH